MIDSREDEGATAEDEVVLVAELPRPACAELSGIWRRGAAFLLDLLPLAIPAWIVAFVASDWLVTVYPHSRLVALPAIVAYRAYFQARDGCTPGQRAFGLRVARRDGSKPTGRQAVLRNVLWAAPLVIEHGMLPGVGEGSFVWPMLAGLLLTGFQIASIYLLIFNRATRQALPDLLAGTFVWRGAGATEARPVRPLPLRHATVMAGVMLTAGVLPVAMFQQVSGAMAFDLKPLMDLRQELLATGRYRDVGVRFGTSAIARSGRPTQTTRTLQVTVTGKVEEATEICHDIQERVKAHAAALPAADRVSVEVQEGYDVFFMSGRSFSRCFAPMGGPIP